MFDVDLMNKSGLQKIISKVKIEDNAVKHEILFGNLDSNQGKNITKPKKVAIGSPKDSPLSLFITLSILFVFVVFGLFRFENSIKIPSFITKTFSSDTSSLDVGKSLIISFLSSPDRVGSLNSMDIGDDLFINVNINQIEDLKLKSRELEFLNIVENEKFYNASFRVPLNKEIIKVDPDFLLLEMLDEYNSRSDVYLNADAESIYFTANGKTTYEILDQLLFARDIKITKNSDKHFTLQFPY